MQRSRAPRFRPLARLASGTTVQARLRSRPYDFAVAARLAGGAGLLARRSRRCWCAAAWASPRRRARSSPRGAHPLAAWPGWPRPRRGSSRHVERGSRITVHGDYDVDGVCSTAILVRALRTLGARRRLVPAEPDRRRLRARAARRSSAWPRAGTQPADHGRLRDHRRRGGRRRPRRRHRRRRHRPPHPARRRRAARRADRAPAARRLPVPGPVRRGRRLQARAGAAGRRRGGPRARRRGPRPRRAGHGRRRRAAAGREPPARARGPARAGRHAQARAARADGGRPRGPERARRVARSASASARGSTPPGACTAPTPGSSCC